MAKHPETGAWSIFGAASGLGSLFIASGCSGSCGACFGCVGTGLIITTVALIRGRQPATTKGEEDGMASPCD